jgi:hypothetical protein
LIQDLLIQHLHIIRRLRVKPAMTFGCHLRLFDCKSFQFVRREVNPSRRILAITLIFCVFP